MKNIITLFAMLAMVAGVAVAAPKAEKKIATVVFTTDIDCAHCAEKVYNSIPFEKGIKDVKVDVKTKNVTVQYDEAKNNVESLIKAFESIKVKVLKTQVKNE